MKPDWKIERRPPPKPAVEQSEARLYLSPSSPAYCVMVEPHGKADANLRAWCIPYAMLNTADIVEACRLAPAAMIVAMEAVIAELREMTL